MSDETFYEEFCRLRGADHNDDEEFCALVKSIFVAELMLAEKWRADKSYHCHSCSSDMTARENCADELEVVIGERGGVAYTKEHYQRQSGVLTNVVSDLKADGQSMQQVKEFFEMVVDAKYNA